MLTMADTLPLFVVYFACACRVDYVWRFAFYSPRDSTKACHSTKLCWAVVNFRCFHLSLLLSHDSCTRRLSHSSASKRPRRMAAVWWVSRILTFSYISLSWLRAGRPRNFHCWAKLDRFVHSTGIVRCWYLGRQSSKVSRWTWCAYLKSLYP